MIDTDVFYSFFDTKDKYHLDSVAMLTHCIEGRCGQPFTTDYINLEVATLLQKRLASEVAAAFIDFLYQSKISTFVIEGEDYESTVRLFRKHFKRLSFCDASTITAMDALNISNLATYDKRSFTGLVGLIYGDKDFESLSDSDKTEIRKLLKRH